MNVLNAMSVFVTVAELGSFAAASRKLDLSTTSISRLVQDFETWMGAPLITRTTRKLALTEAGEFQLESCRRVIAETESMRSNAASTIVEAAGQLRVTAPPFIARRLLAGLLTEYLKLHPKVNLELVAIDREVDLIAEGFDMALRIGVLANSTLRARKLCDVSLVLVASPSYLAKYGKPRTLRDLDTHNCIVDTIPEHAERWPLADASVKKHFRATGNIAVNSGEIVETMVLEGAGIAYLPDFFVNQHITDGSMVKILDHLQSPALGMYLVYPQTRQLPRKTRAFIDLVVERVQQRSVQSD
jgi:DNA-binding transcriptional LysR family regulator